MTYNPEIHKRKSIRLKGYDYTQNGFYFITICTKNKECIFGEIKNDGRGTIFCSLNTGGKIVEKYLKEISKHYPKVIVDSFVVMPNHIHAVMILDDKQQWDGVGVPLVGTQNENENENILETGRPQGYAPTNKTVGEIIGTFKSLTTNEYIKKVKKGEFPEFEGKIWQRNFHEHIIRNEKSLEKIQNYIIHNPDKWEDDMFFRL